MKKLKIVLSGFGLFACSLVHPLFSSATELVTSTGVDSSSIAGLSASSSGLVSVSSAGLVNASSAGFASSSSSSSRFVSTSSYPLLSHRAMHGTAQEAEIFEFDKSALNGRKVLLLIHGGGAEKRRYFRWNKLLKALKANKEFGQKYKVYLYRYNSDEKLAVTTPQLRDAVLKLKLRTGDRPIALLCLSMGGNLAQQAMLDADFEKAVQLVFCMATPFHGSPLFCPGWFQYSLDRPWYMPWARPVHNLDYLLYFSRHRSLQDDLRWDDFDNMIPDLGKFKSALPLGPSGTLTVKADANPALATINESPKIDKSKFITYGGYLVNIYLMKGERKVMEETVLAPWHYLTVKLPVQLGREHPALRLLNFEMSTMKMNDAADKPTPSPHTYELNDGITPVNSAIYLPPKFIKTHPMLEESMLPAISQKSDVKLTRIFRDMDHISFLDGKPPRHFGRKTLIDQAHPSQGRKMLFDWLIADLLEQASN